jgi:site-specific DNA-methyltransferase (adenine-specific)
VADPFLGLGSTAVACATLGVDFVGIELDEGYLKEAIERTAAVLCGALEGRRAPRAGRERSTSRKRKA